MMNPSNESNGGFSDETDHGHDGSNGASHKIAPAVFRDLGAKVIATHCRAEGAHINDKCGSMHPEVLSRAVKKYRADMGFAFDGDSDRIIACDENGNLIDGDVIIFMLAKYLKQKGKLVKNTVVGTRHTNMGLEKDLNKEGISLLRTDIGDKYVIAKIKEDELSLGMEVEAKVIEIDAEKKKVSLSIRELLAPSEHKDAEAATEEVAEEAEATEEAAE